VKSGLAICQRLAGGTFPQIPPPEEALRLLSFDKKIRQGKLKFVALTAPGESILVQDVDPKTILEVASTLAS
jgi:3-dehydroquinate synthetase